MAAFGAQAATPAHLLECQLMARSSGPASACSNAVSHPEWSSVCAITCIHKTNVFLAHMGASDGLPTQRCFCDDSISADLLHALGHCLTALACSLDAPCLDLGWNLDLQRDALTKAGCERIFEKKSGKGQEQAPAKE
jgi:hypothetical protein